MSSPTSNATALLAAHTRGDPEAAAKLFPIVYGELRALAGACMRDERSNHTLQPTALVHEAYLRLIDVDRIDWSGRSHFLAFAARTMRRVLVDHARARDADKRAGARELVPISGFDVPAADEAVDVLGLDVALEKLARVDARQARIIELHAFAGLTLEEIAAVLGVSRDTVKLDWRAARAWLHRELALEGGA